MTDALIHQETHDPAGEGGPAAEDVYVFPLSFAQQRLWFFQQMYPGSSTYNMPVAMRLKGRLDVEHLRAALCEVARRHEVLRTSIDLMGDRPAQLISEEAEIALPVLDLSAVPDDERDAEARRLATEEVTRAFDLRRGPLLRARVLRLSPEEHVLLIVIHHIISDGWSIGVLMNEVVELYDAYTTGREPALPELPIQYADYAVWQREWLTGDVLEEQLAYWRGQLGGAPPVLTLPTDRPRPQVQTLAGAHFEFALPEGLPAGLRQLCRDEGVTMFMLLLAAFQALLSRYSGQTDVTVGTPIAGRNRAEVEGLIGFFANTLVLRADLSGEPTFRELLRRVKKTCLGAYAHQEMPLERMVEELQPERSLSHAPLFQVLFALQNTPAESFNMPGLEMSPAELDLTTTAFDLTLNVEEFGEDIYCRLRYNTDLFEPETVRRMAGHYVTLLGAAAEDAERPVAELPLLSEAERRRALEEWSGGRREPAPDAHVHVLFERQAARTPDGAALVFEGRQLGYAELNRRADQLARHLSGLGVGPESAVAVCVRRSFEMFVGILGVLKAGGAYVPLDPAAPPERVRFVLEDTSASVLLTQRGLAASLPTTRARVICLDENYSAGEDDAPADGVGGLAPPALAPDNLAYVIYTSGSTGRPKGVMVSHASLANTIHARFAQIGETPAGTLLQMSYVFDGSLLSIFCALTQGGVLVIPREGQQSDPAVAAELIAAGRLPHLYTVPSFYSLLLEQARPGQLDSLRVVTVGAEVCTPQLVGEHRRVLPRARLFNEYGPTEATVYCAAHECGAEDAARASVPVGRPTCNMRLYVLDRHLQPVPVGVSGGLYVGGPGLARGYLNRAGLTAESFIPNPFSAEPGTRLYRTGDLARHDADGRIVFLGRLDSQVKIRGYRIELEEIEAALGECRAVRQAAAAVREDAPGDARLVAYLVADDAHAPTAEDLREHLRARLPDYMVPSAFVFVEELPRTAAGKVDRRALPSAGGARPRLAGAYVEPRTALERLLAETWRDVLGAEQVGVNDNFFDLGGDSLRAAILVNKLQQRLGDFVYVVALFEAPTVAALAAYLTEHYSAAVSRVVGVEDGGAGLVAGADEGSSRAVNAESLARVREVIGVATPAPETNAAKNSPAVFVLSPPRSGSTLLRVMLAGHPSLFAPPELELLSFNTLAERREALSGKYSFWLEGTVRALMEIKGCGMEEARRLMEECEERNFSVPQFYGLMQEWIGGRMLVDKTPSYALDREVLRRAENHFDGARYVHLLRHPYGMIRSFEEAKLEQVFFRYRHSFSRRELA
ncbi:MAG: amino acid adenylation domain-containing protein, partial [Pyrinomonadaceae bacterium]